MRKKIGIGLLCCIGALAPASLLAQTRDLGTRGESLDRIVAVVNDGVILQSELDAETSSISRRLQDQKVELPPPSVFRQQVLERLVLQEIQMQRAKRQLMSRISTRSA